MNQTFGFLLMKCCPNRPLIDQAFHRCDTHLDPQVLLIHIAKCSPNNLLITDETSRIFLAHWANDFYLGHQTNAIKEILNGWRHHPVEPDLLFATDEDFTILDEEDEWD